MKKTPILKLTILASLIGLFALPAFAQNQETISVDGDGEFHTRHIVFGGRTLKAGMYRISQIAVNSEHFIVIRKVGMNRYGKGMGPLRPSNEVARIKCVEEKVFERNRKSKILLRGNLTGDRVAIAVWFRGENVKHVLPPL